MKSSVIKYLIFFVFSIPLCAQDAWQLLEKKSSNLNDSEKVNLYLEFAWKNRGDNPELSIKSGKIALNIIEKNELFTKKPLALNYLGVIYRNLGDYKEALAYFSRGLEAAKRYNDKLQLGHSYNNLGSLHRLMGNGSLAIEQTFKGLKIFEEIKDSSGIAFCALNLGVLYSNQKNYTKAIEYLQRVIDIRKKINDKPGELTAQLRIAEVYFELREYDKAYSIYRYTLDEHKKRNEEIGMAFAFGGISTIYFTRGDFKEALNYRLKSLEINSKINQNVAIISDYCQVALIHARLNDFATGKTYLDKAVALAAKIKSFYFSFTVFNTASQFYGLQQDFKNAFDYSRLAAEMKDSIRALEGLEKSAQIEAVYRNEKTEREAELAQIQLANKEQETTYLYLIIVVVIGLFAFVFYAYRQKRKLNHELREINQFKDKLFRVIAHDLKNPFFVVLGYSEMLLDDFDTLTDDEKLTFINNIKHVTVNNYQLLENLLEWSQSNLKIIQPKFEMVNLSTITHKAFDLFKHSARMKMIEMTMDVSKDLMMKTDQNLIYSILRNLLGNSLKFTNKEGKVSLKWFKNGDSIHLEVEDNGIGMNPLLLENILDNKNINRTKGTDGEGGSGIGLSLVYEFVHKLNGDITISSEEGKGTKFSIIFPKIV
jgi:signal transduction histidine kinase